MAFFRREHRGPAALIASGALILGAVQFEPALAQGLAAIGALVTCSSTSPCASWQNTGTGTGIQAAAVADGIRGITSGASKSGVYGESDSASGGNGVHGTNSAANGTAVYATGGKGTGVLATSSGTFGIESSVSTGYGLYATASSGVGALAYSSSGYGLLGESSTGIGLYASSYSPTATAAIIGGFGTSAAQYDSDGVHVFSDTGNAAVLSSGNGFSSNGISAFTADGGKFGAIIGGASQGLIALDGAGVYGIPLQAGSANSAGTGTGFFYVDGVGNVHYTGSLISYARTRLGSNVTAYDTKATQASVEDSGTAELVAGSAVVKLDPAFAQSIDLSTPYRVFLTPNGDTRGLYVAQKTPTSFIVRETQGGRATLGFDYRILATAAGRSGERMTMVTPAVAAKAFPMMGAHPGAGTAAVSGRPPTPPTPAGAPKLP